MLKSTLLCWNEHINYAGIISRPQSIKNIPKYLCNWAILEMINEVLDSSDVNVTGQFTMR